MKTLTYASCFNLLLSVWTSGETLFLVFDIIITSHTDAAAEHSLENDFFFVQPLTSVFQIQLTTLSLNTWFMI